MNLTRELQHKANLLREAPLFIDTSGSGNSCNEKATIFLVLAGAKPMGEALSGHIQRIGNAGKAFADDSLQVAEFLTTLGLYFDLSDSDKSVTQALVSLDPLLLVRYREAEDDQATIGRLFGYPETAIKAFAEGEDKLLPVEEADIHISEAGLSHSFVGFRLSKAYWREELAVVRQWQEILLAYGLINPTQ